MVIYDGQLNIAGRDRSALPADVVFAAQAVGFAPNRAAILSRVNLRGKSDKQRALSAQHTEAGFPDPIWSFSFSHSAGEPSPSSAVGGVSSPSGWLTCSQSEHS
jgi:hypothetical protein